MSTREVTLTELRDEIARTNRAESNLRMEIRRADENYMRACRAQRNSCGKQRIGSRNLSRLDAEAV